MKNKRSIIALGIGLMLLVYLSGCTDKENVKEGFSVNYEKAIVSEGNINRITKVMQKAKDKDPITIGVIGGSITQGSAATSKENTYGYLVYKWWQEKFPEVEVNFINAGIGATTSQFGVHRVDQDLLQYKPDFVIVEYSVNDEENERMKECYEGLLSKILEAPEKPGVIVLNMMMYDTGYNVQTMHNQIAENAQVPIISMKNGLYEDIKEGNLLPQTLSADNLHPNDLGHQYAADFIIFLLEKIYNEDNRLEEQKETEKFMTANRYTDAICYNNSNITPINLGDFIKDEVPQEGPWDIFKKGWKIEGSGEGIHFELEGGYIAVQYKCSPSTSGTKVLAIVDGDEEHAIPLDADFEGGWGDYMKITDLLHDETPALHTVEIRVISVGEVNNNNFYLNSILVANK